MKSKSIVVSPNEANVCTPRDNDIEDDAKARCGCHTVIRFDVFVQYSLKVSSVVSTTRCEEFGDPGCHFTCFTICDLLHEK